MGAARTLRGGLRRVVCMRKTPPGPPTESCLCHRPRASVAQPPRPHRDCPHSPRLPPCGQAPSPIYSLCRFRVTFYNYKSNHGACQWLLAASMWRPRSPCEAPHAPSCLCPHRASVRPFVLLPITPHGSPTGHSVSRSFACVFTRATFRATGTLPRAARLPRALPSGKCPLDPSLPELRINDPSFLLRLLNSDLLSLASPSSVLATYAP